MGCDFFQGDSPRRVSDDAGPDQRLERDMSTFKAMILEEIVPPVVNYIVVPLSESRMVSTDRNIRRFLEEYNEHQCAEGKYIHRRCSVRCVVSVLSCGNHLRRSIDRCRCPSRDTFADEAS